jgi:hypothetical protein
MDEDPPSALFFMAIALVLAFVLLSWSYAYPHDAGQWGDVDPTVREWYQKLMQPDVPNSSCCGEADAYWCDTVLASTEGGKMHMSCRITDDRPDGPLGRPHVEVGTEIEIPANKLKWDHGNPTGHAIVFLGGGRAEYVLCFVQSTGI